MAFPNVTVRGTGDRVPMARIFYQARMRKKENKMKFTKQQLLVTVLAASSLIALPSFGQTADASRGTAWSKSPAVPRDAMAAGVVDVRRTMSGATDILDLLRKNLPPDLGQRIEEWDMSIKDVKAESLQKGFNLDDIEWGMVVIGVCKDFGANTIEKKIRQIEQIGFVLCMKDTSGVNGFMEMFFQEPLKVQRIAGAEVFSVKKKKLSVCIVDENQVVIVPQKYNWDSDNYESAWTINEPVIKALVRACRGYGKSDDKFASLATLESGVCGRFVIPDIGGLVDRLGLREEVSDAIMRSGDDDLANTVFKMGSLVVDAKLDSENSWGACSLTLATEKDARQLYGLLSSCDLLWRAALDAGMIALSYNMREIKRELVRDGFPERCAARLEDVARAARREVSDAVKASISGKTVTLSLKVPVRKIITAAAAEFGK